MKAKDSRIREEKGEEIKNEEKMKKDSRIKKGERRRVEE